MPLGFRLRRVGITITITMTITITNYEHDKLGTPISYLLTVYCLLFTVHSHDSGAMSATTDRQL